MDTDELEPRKPAPKRVDLETLSVEAIAEYIEGLEAEITRAKAAIATKKAARAAADGFFKR